MDFRLGHFTEIESLPESDSAVIVDALRASSTVATLLDVGANEVKPTTQAAKHEDGVKAGEDHGEPLDGCDLGNSPLEIHDKNELVRDKRIYLQTTNGINCVKKAEQMSNVMMGALVNKSAVVETYRRFDGTVWIIPAGRHGDDAVEDLYASVEILAECSRDAVPDEHLELLDRDARDVFLESDTGAYLRQNGRRKDVIHCTQRDIYSSAPLLKKNGFVDVS